MLKFSSITFQEIKEEIELYLKRVYNKAGEVFSPASPFGQLLFVTEQLFQLSMLYLKNAIRQFDMSDVTANNKKIIRSNAIVAGHNPSRNISASGVLKFVLRASSNPQQDIPGGKITIFNKTLIKNKTNGLDYIIDLGGADKVTYNIVNGTNFYVNILQGKYTYSDFTGTGEPNQSYQANIQGNKSIENFNVEVTVNGEEWSIKNHIYEMIPGEKACVVRTAFNGGIDVIFGNGNFGEIPDIASTIRVTYLESDGSSGNIYRRTVNDWTIIEDVLDGFGTSIDITQFFDVNISADINFGADEESIEFTRNILPINSNNFVLALPQQYAYWIKRLGVFSYVNAYNQDGTVIITATPNIRLFKNRNADYFTVDKSAFVLDSYEISKIDKYLKTSGVIQLSKQYKIESPILSYYIMNVFLVVYDDSNMETIRMDIQNSVSEYFLNFSRVDRVPTNDLINIISEIDGVDSVEVQFISKQNEDYHAEYIIKDQNRRNPNFVDNDQSLTDIKPFPNYNPNETRGLDPILGDIIFDANEIPIIRGGWKDRNGVYYDVDPSDSDSSLTSLNIIKKGQTSRKNNKV